MHLIHASLFSGIGGFEEGAERAGIKTVFAVEQQPFRRMILQQRNPNLIIYDDVRTADYSQWKGQVDILSGGFPCQDISRGGKGAGIYGSRSILWREYKRAIAQIRPGYAILENSTTLNRRGLEVVLCDLAEIGYDAEWDCLQCSAFGMPHQRERLILIAYPQEIGRPDGLHRDQGNSGKIFLQMEAQYEDVAVPGDHFERFRQRMGEPAIRGMDDGFPGRSHIYPRIEALGDAISPVLAEYIFHCIIHHNNLHHAN